MLLISHTPPFEGWLSLSCPGSKHLFCNPLFLAKSSLPHLLHTNCMHKTYARFTLAEPMPRLCPDAVGSANVNGLPTRIGRRGLIGRPSGGHRAILNMFNIARRRRPIGSRTCTTQLRVVINKTLSPYQPGSRTILYDSLVPTDTLRAIRPM